MSQQLMLLMYKKKKIIIKTPWREKTRILEPIQHTLSIIAFVSSR